MIKGKVVIACLFSCQFFVAATPKPTFSQHQYTRKAVAAVTSVTFREKKIELTPSRASIFNDVLVEHLIINRYDEVKLPTAIQSDLAKRLHGKVVESNELTTILNELLAPFFENVMRVTAQERAEENKAGFDRAIFITKKAKEIGVTAEDLDTMMRCGYLFVPFISLVEIKKQDSDEKYSARVSGGVSWYHLEGVGQPKLRMIKSIEDDNRSSGFLKGTADGAFRDASTKVAKNVFLQSIDDPILKNVFSTKGVITRKKGNTINISLGRKEDLKIDDRLEVYEISQQRSGKVVYKKIGHCMVRQVADNRKHPGATSTAKRITGSGFLPGMEVREVAISGLDIAVRTILFQAKLDYLPPETGFSVRTPTDEGAYGIELETGYNIGPNLNTSQLYTLVSVNYKYVPVKASLDIDSDTYWEISHADSWSFYGGLMKRLYLGPLALRLDTMVGYSTFRFNMSAIECADNKEKRSLKTANFDYRAAAGLEIALTTKSNFGVYAGYRGMIFDWDWILENDGNKVDDFGSEGGINHDGFFMGASFTYAMKSLF